MVGRRDALVNWHGRYMVNICLWIEQSGRKLRALLYPPECVLCGNPGAADQDICSGCLNDLPWNRHACLRCALPLPPASSADVRCARCQQHPPPFDRAWSLLRYTTASRWLHRRLKFGSRLANGRLLATLLGDALVQALSQGVVMRPDCILVMPLHPRRLMRRGFNQSLELIRPAARQLDIGLDYLSLRRVKATRPQSELSANRRRSNVRGAFVCDRNLAGLRVALFDDVVTTGHTVAEATRVLRRAGAEEISVWSLARTDLSF
jgi:ComF family protein